MTKRSLYFTMFNVTVVLLGLIAFAYLRYVDGTFIPVIDVDDLSTVKTEYHLGETVQIRSTYCRNRKTVTEYQWKMFNHVETDFTPRESNPEEGCYRDRITDVEIIPRNTALGDHYLELTATYTVNPLRKVTYVYRTNSFNIIK